MAKPGKPVFAPMPARAVVDLRLTGLHLRVLAAICLHDRMSSERQYGQGCWAGNQTLARECGCHYTNLSTAITDLGRWGYVERRPHPLNRRLRVLFVIYNEADRDVVKVTRDRESSHGNGHDSLPTDKPSPTESDPIVCPDFGNETPDQSLSGVEYIPQKREEIKPKAQIDSAEAARPTIGATLAQLERALKQGTLTDLSAWHAGLVDIQDSLSYDDPNFHRTARLLEEIEARMGARRG